MSEGIQTVRVPLGPRSYDIEVGTGIRRELADRIRARISVKHALVVTDEVVLPLYGQAMHDQLCAVGIDAHLLSVPAGEESKSVTHLNRLWESALDAGANRQTVLVAVGGGVVGDLAGFVAASLTRGIPFVQVPTTLLAQVDSSVGGKVGINLTSAKNMVGAFWQPRYVLVDTEVLTTLSDREYRAGLAEVVKYGVIMDADLFRYLEDNIAAIQQRSAAVLRHIVARCCQLKAHVVAEDETETSGRRAILNYGHTFAHALEAVSGYGRLLHGEAVSIGMLCASRLANKLGWIEPELTNRQADLLSQLGLPLTVPKGKPDQWLAAMSHDKKNVHGNIRFILPTKLGEVKFADGVDPEKIIESLTDGQ